MNYQEMEDQVNQNMEDIQSMQEAFDESNLVGGVGGLSLPLDPNVAQIMDDETVSYFSDKIGSATLVAGTITVNNPYVQSTSIIILSRKTIGGTAGYLSLGAVIAGISFVINSSSATDTSVVNYLIFP
ncbi:hypothetical protein M1295_01485 [Patescibacteria group bacterium]|nr:hypothetical protein [Patescibacteria group bacterium]